MIIIRRSEIIMSVKSMDGKRAIRLALPLIISLLVIVSIGIVATLLSREKPDPTVSNPNEAFVTIGDYSVTNGTVYRNLKVNYGLFELQNLIDRELLKDYLAQVDDDAVQARIDKAMYDNTSEKTMTKQQVAERKNSLTADEKAQVEEAFNDSQYLIGRRTPEDIWAYYELEEAKRVYALEKYREEIAKYEQEASEKQKKEVSFFTDTQIENFFKAYYKPDVKALVVYFNSEAEALDAMKSVGVQKHSTGSRWIKFDPEKPTDNSSSELDIDDFNEILDAFVKLYNKVNCYYDPVANKPIKEDDIDWDNHNILNTAEANPFVKLNYNYEILNGKNTNLATQLFSTLLAYEELEEENVSNEDFYTDDIHDTYTYAPRTDSNDRYFLAIKLEVTGEIKLLENVRAEIKEKLPNEYITDSKISEKILEMRREAGLVLYDKYFERMYSSTDTKFKTTKKVKDTVVAEYKVNKETKQVTADELFAILANNYAAKDIAKIVNKEILVLDETYNKVYDVVNDKVLDKDEYENFKELILGYRNAFAQGYFSSMGFPPSYGWKNFMRDNFGVESQKDLIVPLALFEYVLNEYREASYTVDDVIAKMKKAVTDFFEANIMNIVISVDYNNDSQPDKNVVGEISPASNWTAEQKALVPDFIDALLVEKSKWLSGVDHPGAIQKAINVYNDASIDDPVWGEFKLAGLRVEYEDYEKPTNNETPFVEEFLRETEKLWKIAKDEGLLGMMTTPIWNEHAFESSYGFHYIGISSASDYTYADLDEKILLVAPEGDTSLNAMSLDELKALIALYEREKESQEDPDKALTDEEKDEIEEKLTTQVRAALAKYYDPAVQYFEEYNSSGSGKVDLKLDEYREAKGMTFTIAEIEQYYDKVLEINQKTHDKTYDLED